VRTQSRGPDLLSFLDEDVLPRLYGALDAAFPEFGWRAAPKGWVASNAHFTRQVLGARPERVVCRIPAGFYVHGAGAQSWVSYVAKDPDPRGRVFVEAVRDLARRAGAGDLPAAVSESGEAGLARWEERERKALLLAGLWERAYRALRNGSGEPARRYLAVVRGLSSDQISHAALGWIPEESGALAAWAREIGVETAVLADLGLLRSGAAAAHYGPSAWTGRLVGLVRDLGGRVVNLWGRTVREGVEPKYLYLRGCERRSIGAVGLFEATVQSKDGREDLVLVEGVFDVASLAARGFSRIAALGGSAREVDEAAIRRLVSARVTTVTLALDADDEGWRGFDTLVPRWGRVAGAPALFAVDPAGYAGAKDPEELVRRSGLEAFTRLVDAAPLALDLWLRRRLAGLEESTAPSWKARVRLADEVLALANGWNAPPCELSRYRLRAAAAAVLDAPAGAPEETRMP